MDDGEYWPRDYDVWHDLATKAISRLAVEGVAVHQQSIDPDEFAAWCEAHDRPADSDARLTFAAIEWRDRSRP